MDAKHADSGSLTKQFGVPGIVWFDEHRGLLRLHLRTAQCEATVYVQGAHVTVWRPGGHEPVIFVSPESEFAPGKPIRGGIPVVFPWFATDIHPDRIDGHPGPTHGFARIQDWTLESVHRSAQTISLRWTLGATAMSRSMGFDEFLLTLDMVFGETFDMQLTVRNLAGAPLRFEEAFHTFFRVVDVHEATVSGLENAAYLDKTDHAAPKPATGEAIHPQATTDRVYQNTTTPCLIHDGAQRREIRVVKRGSHSTVVWTPWRAVAEIGEWSWHEMLCVETANVAADARTLAPGESHSMGMHVSITKIGAAA